MTDAEKREKIIKELETIVDQMECEVAEWVNYSDSELNDGLTVDCDWWRSTLGKLNDALELLKAQEPVKPVVVGKETHWYECECGAGIDYRDPYCRGCGRAVKWE